MSKNARPEDMPDHVKDTLARGLLRACERFFADPDNQRRFEEWKARKAAEGASA